MTTSDVKVIDVALKYGYQTPESFTKAFRKIHGVNPSEVRESGIKLKAYPRISFQIQLKGEKEMNYKIVDKEGLKLLEKGSRLLLKMMRILRLYLSFGKNPVKMEYVINYHRLQEI